MISTNGDGELRPRFMPQREALKRVKADVPESVAGDFEEYCRFVAESAGVEVKEVVGEVMAAALKEFMKADKAFPKWKEKQLADVSSDEVDEALSGLGAGAPQETPRPAERPARPAAASPSGGGAAAGGGSSAAGKSSTATPPPPSSRSTTSTAAQT